MACFIVPATEAIITGVASKLICHDKENASQFRVALSDNLKGLTKLLSGGSFLLAFEHVWHGEVVPFYPFLTAMSSEESTATMLHEMSTTGVGMALLTTAIWMAFSIAKSNIRKAVRTQ